MTHLDDEPSTETFDAWRKAQKAARGDVEPQQVFGRSVILPTSLPLGFSFELEELADSDDKASIQRMVGVLYGDDALDHWIEVGADLFEFQVLLGYGYAHATGSPISFDEAAAQVQRANEDGQGKERRRKAPQDRKPKKRRPGRR